MAKRIAKNYTTLGDPSAFSGLANLAARYPKKTRSQLANVLAGIDTYSRHKEAKPVKRYNPYIVRASLQLLQLDLLDVRQLANQNDGVKYILMIIDTFSRRAWGFPLRNKQAQGVVEAFENFLDVTLLSRQKKKVERVLTDRGREFNNRRFQAFLRERNISLSHPNEHAPHVERLNRSIQRILYAHLTEEGTRRYIDRLDDVFNSYNKRPHSAHNMPPEKALAPANDRKVKYVLAAKLEKHLRTPTKKPRFEVGDFVRLVKPRATFSRSYKETHRQEIFQVRAVIRAPLPVPMYQLSGLEGEEITGKFYANQLTAVRVGNPRLFRIGRIVDREPARHGRAPRVLIKWQGYKSPRYNTWMSEAQARRYL